MNRRIVSAVRGFKPYPWGPRNRAAVLAACKETNCQGWITGGPFTPDEWYHWNAARIVGWQGRYPSVHVLERVKP